MMSVFLDTNVLYSESILDLLRHFQSEGLLRVSISQTVLAEFGRAVGGFTPLPSLPFTPVGLPDAQDEAILADALSSQAQVLLSFNLKDFPVGSIYPLRGLTPDDWLVENWEVLKDSIERHRQKGPWPEKNEADYAQRLSRARLFKTRRKLHPAPDPSSSSSR